MNAARENAERLAGDARLLLDAGRFPTAASLAALAIEEAGKPSILRALTLARDDKERSQDWRDYRSHTRKNAAWLLPQLVAGGARKLEHLRPLFDDSSEHPHLLDQVKQLGFYTDCLGDANWSRPSTVIDADLAEMLVRTAEIMVGGEHKVTAKEIELWVKHLAPVWKTSMNLMRHALLMWHEEMVEMGLKADDQMPDFIASDTPDEDV